MNRVAWLFVLTLTVILLSTAAYFFLIGKIGPVANRVAYESADAISLGGKFIEVPIAIDGERKESSAKERYAYNVHFPVVALMSHTDLANEANAVISTFVDDIILDFKTNIIEMYSPLVPSDFSSGLSMRWSADLLSPTIISVRFDYSEYISGSAHPNSRTKILNYDFEKHLILHTEDLFASSTEALPFLSRFTRDELTKQSPNISKDELETMLIPGTEPTSENFANVAIDADGLIVIFNPIQVAPYARGSQDVHVPLSTHGLHLSPAIKDAMHLGKTNIVEATPEAE